MATGMWSLCCLVWDRERERERETGGGGGSYTKSKYHFSVWPHQKSFSLHPSLLISFSLLFLILLLFAPSFCSFFLFTLQGLRRDQQAHEEAEKGFHHKLLSSQTTKANRLTQFVFRTTRNWPFPLKILLAIFSFALVLVVYFPWPLIIDHTVREHLRAVSHPLYVFQNFVKTACWSWPSSDVVYWPAQSPPSKVSHSYKIVYWKKWIIFTDQCTVICISKTNLQFCMGVNGWTGLRNLATDTPILIFPGCFNSVPWDSKQSAGDPLDQGLVPVGES